MDKVKLFMWNCLREFTGSEWAIEYLSANNASGYFRCKLGNVVVHTEARLTEEWNDSIVTRGAAILVALDYDKALRNQGRM